MSSPLLRVLCIATLLLPSSLVRGGEPAAIKIWRFENPEVIAGSRVEIWGAPSFVKTLTESAVCLDGKADGVLIPIIPIADWKSFTIEILFAVDADGNPEQRFLHLEDDKGRRVLVELRLQPEGRWCLDTYLHTDPERRLTLIDRTQVHPAGRWHWAALSYAEGRMIHFVDGVKECEGTVQFEPMSAVGRTSLGVRQNKVSWFKGAIREVRFTPEALPPERLQRIQPTR